MAANPERDRSRVEMFDVVQIAHLKVDRTYQRRYDHGFVQRSLDEHGGTFDIVTSGPILINYRQTRDKFAWIVDGQHRAGMATEAGETEIIAEILRGLSKAEEAELRVGRHSRKADNALERFHARIAAGDPTAANVRKLFLARGTDVAENQAAPTEHIRAIGSAEKVYGVAEGRLERVIYVIEASLGEVTQRTCSSYTMLGLNWFIEHHDFEVDMTRFVQRLKNAGLRQIDSRAKVLASAGGSMWKNYYRAMVEVYNFRTPIPDRIRAKQ
jgi:hypothetical protein